MKVYIDQSIIDEWLKFKLSEDSLTDYVEDTKKTAIIGELETFGKILELSSIMFLYSPLNELERSGLRKNPFDELVSRINFNKVPAVGLRICMVDQELPKDNIMGTGEVQSYFASHIRKFGPKNINNRNDFMQYMRRKFFDPMHIDSAIKAKADIFLTIDYKLLSSIEKHSEFKTFLANKIRVFTPSEFIKKVATLHNTE